jgi:excisionase family DNA binding protein
MSNNGDEYLTVRGAAAYLSTSERFVTRLIAERRIRFYRVGRHIRFSVADLRACVAEGCVEPITAQSVRRHVRGVA